MIREIYHGFDKIITEEKNGLITVKIKLHKESFARSLGTIVCAERTLHTKREKDKHLHIKSNSYGFNHALISGAKRFDKVMLIEGANRYLIPNEVILKQGTFLHFQSEGFEKQIFLNLDTISEYRKD